MDFVNKLLTTLKDFFLTLSELFSISPLDLLIVFILFGFLLGFSFQYGKRQIITLIFSLYFASFILLQFPYTEQLLGSKVGNIELAALIVGAVFLFFIGLYIVFNRVTRTLFAENSSRRWFEAGILSAVATTLILALSYHVLPVASIYDFSAPIDRFFEPQEYFFWWLIVPLVVLLFVGKKRNDE